MSLTALADALLDLRRGWRQTKGCGCPEHRLDGTVNKILEAKPMLIAPFVANHRGKEQAFLQAVHQTCHPRDLVERVVAAGDCILEQMA